MRAPASLGLHSAIGLESVRMFTFLQSRKKMNKRKKNVGQYGWHVNTELGIDLKTLLRSDRRMKVQKGYQGVLRRDADAEIEEYRCRDAHYTFVETMPQTTGRRNPHVFDGTFITVTRQSDGKLRLNFKRLVVDADFCLERYALGVYNEICVALEGLVEK